MSTFEQLLAHYDGRGDRTAHERWWRANAHFEQRRYIEAAEELELLTQEADGPGLTQARLLLARAYFHSAQLGRAAQVASLVVEQDPTDGYARQLLGRSLERAGRKDEAAGHLRVARALGAE